VAPVFRKQPPSHAEWRRESNQIGCELIGTNTDAADLELLVIACEVLRRLELDSNCSITLNDVEVFNGIADELGIGADARDELRELVDSRNTADLEYWLRQFTSAEQAQALAAFSRLSGGRNVLDEARVLFSHARSQAALDRLVRVWAVLDALHLSDRFEIDLGDVSRLDYYTGLTFKIYVAGAGTKIGGGGRYDGLTASFGKSEPAVGFVLELDALTELLLNRTEGRRGPTAVDTKPIEIASAELATAFSAAMKQRSAGQRVLLKGEVQR
jgi:ATP phosphoribosyltransferase regulatory subunit